jgi:hypothetical protein
MKFNRNLRGETLVAYKSTLKLTQEQKDIIIGTLLGDSTMRLTDGVPIYAIKFEQGIKNKEYVEHLFDIFKPYCGSGPNIRILNKEQDRKSIYFQTYRHDDFIFYYNSFYKITESISNDAKITKKGIKSVPKNIHQFLTARAVSYWFMDDGTYNTDIKSGKRSYLFSTQGFTQPDCQRLCDALKTNFGINSKVHRDKKFFRIYVNADSSEKLIDLVAPYIHSDFLYKL